MEPGRPRSSMAKAFMSAVPLCPDTTENGASPGFMPCQAGDLGSPGPRNETSFRSPASVLTRHPSISFSDSVASGWYHPLARGVTVARLTLDQLVLVRIQAGQQTDNVRSVSY